MSASNVSCMATSQESWCFFFVLFMILCQPRHLFSYSGGIVSFDVYCCTEQFIAQALGGKDLTADLALAEIQSPLRKPVCIVNQQQIERMKVRYTFGHFFPIRIPQVKPEHRFRYPSPHSPGKVKADGFVPVLLSKSSGLSVWKVMIGLVIFCRNRSSAVFRFLGSLVFKYLIQMRKAAYIRAGSPVVYFLQDNCQKSVPVQVVVTGLCEGRCRGTSVQIHSSLLAHCTQS